MATPLLRSASAAPPSSLIAALGSLAGATAKPQQPSKPLSVAAAEAIAAWGASLFGADALTGSLPVIGAQVLQVFPAPLTHESSVAPAPTDAAPAQIPEPVPTPQPKLPAPPDPPAPLAPPAPVPTKLPSLPDPPDPSSPRPGSPGRHDAPGRHDEAGRDQSGQDDKAQGIKAAPPLWARLFGSASFNVRGHSSGGIAEAMMRESMRERVLGRGGFARFGHR